ncbi:MAG: Flp family type IVb pilin [Phycisphaerae bacterium]|nr:Flp family type IVb pilin [Phycisphaerae bacterium]
MGSYAKEFWDCESGATATEYAVMIALILLVVIAAVAALGTKVSNTFADAERGF